MPIKSLKMHDLLKQKIFTQKKRCLLFLRMHERSVEISHWHVTYFTLQLIMTVLLKMHVKQEQI